jgi:hypothetical protein
LDIVGKHREILFQDAVEDGLAGMNQLIRSVLAVPAYNRRESCDPILGQ